MKLFPTLALGLAMAVCALAEDPTPESLFHEGWYKETGLKDLDGAIATYERVVSRAREAEEYAARAQFQIGVCLEKMGKAEQAQAAFQRVVDGYAGQKDWVEKAKEHMKGAAVTPPMNPDGTPAPPRDASDAVLATMKSTKISLNFTEAPLEDVLAFYRDIARINILLDKKVEKPEELKVTLRVEEIPFDSALDLAVKMLDLDWCVEDGVVIVTTPEDAKSRGKKAEKPAEGRDPEWEVAIMRKLETTKIDLDFTDASLEDVVDFLREYSGINIEIDGKLRADGTLAKKLTIQLRDVTLKTALKLMLSQYGLTSACENHVLLIKRDAKPK